MLGSLPRLKPHPFLETSPRLFQRHFIRLLLRPRGRRQLRKICRENHFDWIQRLHRIHSTNPGINPQPVVPSQNPRGILLVLDVLHQKRRRLTQAPVKRRGLHPGDPQTDPRQSSTPGELPRYSKGQHPDHHGLPLQSPMRDHANIRNPEPDPMAKVADAKPSSPSVAPPPPPEQSSPPSPQRASPRKQPEHPEPPEQHSSAAGSKTPPTPSEPNSFTGSTGATRSPDSFATAPTTPWESIGFPLPTETSTEPFPETPGTAGARMAAPQSERSRTPRNLTLLQKLSQTRKAYASIVSAGLKFKGPPRANSASANFSRNRERFSNSESTPTPEPPGPAGKADPAGGTTPETTAKGTGTSPVRAPTETPASNRRHKTAEIPRFSPRTISSAVGNGTP